MIHRSLFNEYIKNNVNNILLLLLLDKFTIVS